jgi:hypothetical protein
LPYRRPALPACVAPSDQLAAAAGRHPRGEVVVDDVVLVITNAILCGSCNIQPVKVAVQVQGGWIEATICDRAAPPPTPVP